MAKRLSKSVKVLGLLAILIITLACFLPLFRAREVGSRRATCPTNLKQIGIALHIYASDWNEHLPSSWEEFANLYPDYIDYLRIFNCPNSSTEKVKSKADIISKSDYAYIPGLTEWSSPTSVLCLDKDLKNHNNQGVHVLTLENKVHWLPIGPKESASVIRHKFAFLYICIVVLIIMILVLGVVLARHERMKN